ncbi:MAG: helix-turn-helix transcriptional regulator [Erysipelotrichaceae bacterium]|nr:helix-turn-helix transcriptional regulator [Erysipelotrichaceae bacterium]
MDLQTLLDEQNLSMYRLSKISGVPKTTVIDICSGKSDIRNCTAYTVYKIAKTLNCSMEDLMLIDTSDFNRESGLPKNRDYLERGLPPYLRKSIEAMKQSWEIEDAGKKDMHWDIVWCDLNADINSAETEQDITHNQARYLREKYLRMEE